MEQRDLTALVRFSEDGPLHEAVLESERMWSEVVCLEPNQGLGPITDRGSDGLCVVLAGEVAVQVDRGRKRLGQWGVFLAPAGSQLVVRNASSDPAVLLLVAAPPPVPRRGPAD